jgi:hypothetical protein
MEVERASALGKKLADFVNREDAGIEVRGGAE